MSAATTVLSTCSRLCGAPTYIQAELTTRCNLRCAVCERSRITGPNTDLPLDTVARIHAELPGVFGRKLVVYNLSGLGEVLLHTSFPDILRLVRNALHVSFTDNFTLFDLDAARNVIDNRVSLVYASVDGATADTVEQMRPGAQLATILDNIDSLQRLKQQTASRRPQLRFRFVPTTENIDELSDVVRLASEHGVGSVSVPMLYAPIDGTALRVDAERLDAARRNAQTTARKTGTTLDWKDQQRQPVQRCWRGRCGCYVCADSTVLPCCFLPQFRGYEAARKEAAFGSLSDSSLIGLWGSDRWRQFRRNIGSGVLPDICCGCPIYGS